MMPHGIDDGRYERLVAFVMHVIVVLLVPRLLLVGRRPCIGRSKQTQALRTLKKGAVLEWGADVLAKGAPLPLLPGCIYSCLPHDLMIRMSLKPYFPSLRSALKSIRGRMLRPVALWLLLFAGTEGVLAQVNMATEGDLVIFDFGTDTEARWSVVNDGVMGGRSKGNGRIESGSLRFWGTLVTLGGGFTSVRTRKRLDLAKYDGIALRVRGSGRTFEVELDDGYAYRGRSISRRAPFQTSEDWRVVRIPFTAFRSSIFGQPVNAGALEPSRIRAVGLYLLDGIDGAFDMEVDAIWAYRESE